MLAAPVSEPLCADAPAARPNPRGNAAELPKKQRKPKKPVRLGVAYVARRDDGAVLLETRPPTGLLGGMLGWPGSDWAEELPDHQPPVEADWCDLGGEVRHTFTHFHLRLRVAVAQISDTTTPRNGFFVPDAQFDPAALPTVMRKVW